MSVCVRVAAWAAWDGHADVLAVGGMVPPARPALPALLRRRVSPLGRKALQAAWAILPADCQPRLILASRHGEYARTFELLTSLSESAEVSPAEFSLAVHHALAGLLSIATGNRQGHSAVAAGADSFGYGLLEAACFVAEQATPALLFYFDEALPPIYAPISDDDGPAFPLALAALLVPQSWPAARVIHMHMESGDGQPGQCPARAFLSVLEQDGEAVAQGGRHAWRWSHAA
ncbi:MAG: hypothetical protein FD176_3165 [Rhodospirillaceae bacterium]|nr:MAG: hypothetical protein FD176_3165 [Rhodospirillaceae bacterium]TNC98835.1 MAG: Uncharacterized protein FD119_306 [Stygiobacter sp.]